MNKSSLDRGFGRCVVLRKYGTTMKKYKNRTTDRVVKPVVPPGQVSVAASTIGLMLQPVVLRLSLNLSLSIGSLFMVTDKIRVRAGFKSELRPSLRCMLWLGLVKGLCQDVDNACTSVVQLSNGGCAWPEYGLGSHTQSSTMCTHRVPWLMQFDTVCNDISVNYWLFGGLSHHKSARLIGAWSKSTHQSIKNVLLVTCTSFWHKA